LTAHYRIDAPATHVETGLTLLPAIASASAIAEATHGRAPVGIKWVNDILIRDRKVSGVLTSTHVQGERVERAIFGIGINVAVAPSIEPTPFVPAAGSLAEYNVSVPTVLDALIGQLDSLVAQLKEGGSSSLFPRYRALADFIDREVSIWPESCDDWRSARPLLSGRVIDLLPDLSLVIEGQADPIRKGRMAYQLA
jgi:biotin-(acetyl-CoA carboxylase) ligase